MVGNCFSVAVFCVCAAIFSIVLKQYCREQSLLLTIAAGVIVLGAFIGVISPVIEQVQEIFTEAGIPSEYISLIFKAAAIVFITQLTCDLCRDSGETAIASAAELWGRGTITVMAVPLIEALLEMITDFL